VLNHVETTRRISQNEPNLVQVLQWFNGPDLMKGLSRHLTWLIFLRITRAHIWEHTLSGSGTGR